MIEQRILSWLGALFGAAVAVGALAAVAWSLLVKLPSYQIGPRFEATLSQAGQAEVIGADAWFVLLGLVGGVLLGILAWFGLRELGFFLPLAAAAAGLGAAVTCASVGPVLGPGSFVTRLSAAGVGDWVPVELKLRSPSAAAVWALAAVITVTVAWGATELVALLRRSDQPEGTAAPAPAAGARGSRGRSVRTSRG